MGLKYICENCGKTFCPEEFARLGMITIFDDRCKMVSKGRKCDYCGKQIKVWRF